MTFQTRLINRPYRFGNIKTLAKVQSNAFRREIGVRLVDDFTPEGITLNNTVISSP